MHAMDTQHLSQLIAHAMTLMSICAPVIPLHVHTGDLWGMFVEITTTLAHTLNDNAKRLDNHAAVFVSIGIYIYHSMCGLRNTEGQ